MPGWNIKEGQLNENYVSVDEYWSLFNYVFSDSCHKTNTYKFCLIKAICDQIYNIEEKSEGYFLAYSQIFERFAENYWNLVLKYGIKQMVYNGKAELSKVESIILLASKQYNIPKETPFSSVNAVDRAKIIKDIRTECKKCVIGALYNDFDGKLYSFSLKEDGIIISRGAYGFISRYKMIIEKINYYSWARFIEKINENEGITKLIDKLELSTPKRIDLSIYREFFLKNLGVTKCFYCNEDLKRRIHVDHFIPWSFVKTNNLWNFVLSCPDCNRKVKHNKLMGKKYIEEINKRNRTLMEHKDENEFVEREFRSYYDGMIQQLWSYAKMSGFKEL